jgi:hypothetical protein
VSSLHSHLSVTRSLTTTVVIQAFASILSKKRREFSYELHKRKKYDSLNPFSRQVVYDSATISFVLTLSGPPHHLGHARHKTWLHSPVRVGV